jgi:hypothetical protein
MSNAVMQNEQLITRRVSSQSVVNFKPVKTFVDSTVFASVQPANLANLNKGEIDYALRYVQVHARFNIDINDSIIHQGTMYTAITIGDFGDYGFWSAVYVESKP